MISDKSLFHCKNQCEYLLRTLFIFVVVWNLMCSSCTCAFAIPIAIAIAFVRSLSHTICSARVYFRMLFFFSTSTSTIQLLFQVNNWHTLRRLNVVHMRILRTTFHSRQQSLKHLFSSPNLSFNFIVAWLTWRISVCTRKNEPKYTARKIILHISPIFNAIPART